MEQREIRQIQAITIQPGAKMQKCWRERAERHLKRLSDCVRSHKTYIASLGQVLGTNAMLRESWARGHGHPLGVCALSNVRAGRDVCSIWTTNPSRHRCDPCHGQARRSQAH